MIISIMTDHRFQAVILFPSTTQIPYPWFDGDFWDGYNGWSPAIDDVLHPKWLVSPYHTIQVWQIDMILWPTFESFSQVYNIYICQVLLDIGILSR